MAQETQDNNHRKFTVAIKSDRGEIRIAEVSAPGEYLWRWEHTFNVGPGIWNKLGYFINDRWAWMPLDNDYYFPMDSELSIKGSISADMYKTLGVIIIEENIFEAVERNEDAE